MTIREVLSADWTVGWIDIDVRRKEDTRLICNYLIGKEMSAPKRAKFVCETAAGDIYKDGNIKMVISDRIIQFRQLPNKPKGKEMCVGVLEEEIPEELLNLEIAYLAPSGCGRSDDMHGYRFTCYVDFWGGLAGENEQLEIQIE